MKQKCTGGKPISVIDVYWRKIVLGLWKFVRSIWTGQPIVSIAGFQGEPGTTFDIEIPQSISDNAAKRLIVMRRRVIDLVLPEAMVLRRDLTLPNIPRKHIDQSILLNTLQKTPFRQDEILWTRSEPTYTSDNVMVSQWVAKREEVEDLGRWLAEKNLIVRRFIPSNGAAIRPFMDNAAHIFPRSALIHRLNIALILVILLVSLFNWLSPALQSQDQLRQVLDERTRLQTRALELRQNLDALIQEDEERAQLSAAVLDRVSIVENLLALTAILPETTWVSGLSMTQDSLVASVSSGTSAAELQIEISEMEGGPVSRISSPIVRASGGVERFELTFDLGASQ
jgi:general secretion pathway protein L